jgi:hypothetical protein
VALARITSQSWKSCEVGNEPYATIDRDGVRVHIPTDNGGEIAFTLNTTNAQALVMAVARRIAELGTGEGKLKAGMALITWLLK